MTDSASTQALMFPAFLYGEHTPCRRKMKAEAKKWAKKRATKTGTEMRAVSATSN